jgi:hypothetical protein
MTEEQRIEALAQYLELTGDEWEEIAASSYDETLFEYGQQEYLVLTDEEAEQRLDEHLDNLIEDVVLSEIPESLQYYFDDEKWKREARFDGRGHFLSGYDGTEHEAAHGLFIYRTN